LLGYIRREFLGTKLWEIGAFKDIEASKAAFKELQRKGYVRYEDLPLKTLYPEFREKKGDAVRRMRVLRSQGAN